jgi:hypothetical protein
MDNDEIREFYSLQYKASDGCYGFTEDITKKTEVSFEANTLQGVLNHMLTFLQEISFSYVGKITLESKDGKKTWTT